MWSGGGGVVCRGLGSCFGGLSGWFGGNRGFRVCGGGWWLGF